MGDVRVGIVGFGSIAEHAHAPAWESLLRGRVVAVADPSPRRRAAAAEAVPNARLYASGEDLLGDARVTVLDICSPPNSHAPLMLAACKRGIKRIASEKPFVLSPSEWEAVSRAAGLAGARIISVDNWKHSPMNRCVMTLLASGLVGDVERVEVAIGRPDCALGSAGWQPRWRTDLTHAGGGILLDHGWHQLYLLMDWIGARPHSVRATMQTVDPSHAPVEDEASVDLEFPRASAWMHLSWTAGSRTNTAVVHGTRGTLHVLDDRAVVEGKDGPKEYPFAGATSVSSYHPDWFAGTFRALFEPSPARAQESLREAGTLTAIVKAAYDSARDHGRPVRPIISPEAVGVASTGGHTSDGGIAAG